MRRLLTSLARSGARATGRALSAHVVPDSLIPSWKTRKTVSSGVSLLKKAARKTKRVNTVQSTKRATAEPKRPAPQAPKKKFDKNAWSQGRGLASAGGYDEPRRSPAASSSASLLNSSGRRLVQQFSDLRRHPRAVAQMGLDLLAHEYQQKKRRFLSSLPRLKK